MFKVLTFIFAASTVAVGFFAIRESQKASTLQILIADKNNSIQKLEDEKAELQKVADDLDVRVKEFERLEKEQKAREEALNARKVSDEDTKKYGEECRSWIAREFGDDSSFTLTNTLTTINDSWMKDGQLVFEIATPSRSMTTSSIYLCVVDKETESMFKPSAFDTQNWRPDP